METTTETARTEGPKGRELGVVGLKLDFVKATEKAREILTAIYGPRDYTGYTVDPMLVIGNSKGEIALVVTEGVGYVKDSDQLYIDIPLNLGMTFGFVTVPMGLNTIKDLTTDEQVDLADWVRVFGDRLEVNFGIWKRWAKS
jgi:hypothetical protein